MNFRKKVRLGDILLQKEIITTEQLSKALEDQKKRPGVMLGEMLVSLGYVDQKQVNDALCEHLNIEYVDMNSFEPTERVMALLDEEIMRKYTLVPMDFDKNNAGVLKVAMADPMNILAMDDVNIITGRQVMPFLAEAPAIKSYLDRRFGKKQAQNIAELYKKEQGSEEESAEEKARKEDIENAPIVQLVNNIVEQAVHDRASDIHIEPFEYFVKIRYRVDGSLREVMTYEKSVFSALVTRIKIMSGMDISEKRKPQDGRMTVNVDNREYDIRVSCLPTVYGEKIVTRLASKEGFRRAKSELGLQPDDLERFDKILQNPHGIILVTGPTGSGKSTTLYTALSALNSEDVNIITVEDPVEANIDGINQVMVNNKADMTFANALRSILRQDPDIIMIGEIRDSETAEIAVRASITGHLVVSTLHTNGTANSIGRLRDMGIESYLISDSLVGVIAQRLVRRLCECKQAKEASDEEKMMIDYDVNKPLTIYEPCGCKLCGNSGYKGRIGIYEVLTITPGVRKLISKGAEPDEIKALAVEEGMHTLKAAAGLYVEQGITSIAEMIKATYEAE
ncbi:MAG: Flp pilus assembly complex ATPase component TadA [Lachnospira sp.]|nr:Flp pilus assembly complex ATPase component TadA [Lachnospira sp.]